MVPDQIDEFEGGPIGEVAVEQKQFFQKLELMGIAFPLHKLHLPWVVLVLVYGLDKDLHDSDEDGEVYEDGLDILGVLAELPGFVSSRLQVGLGVELLVADLAEHI